MRAVASDALSHPHFAASSSSNSVFNMMELRGLRTSCATCDASLAKAARLCRRCSQSPTRACSASSSRARAASCSAAIRLARLRISPWPAASAVTANRTSMRSSTAVECSTLCATRKAAATSARPIVGQSCLANLGKASAGVGDSATGIRAPGSAGNIVVILPEGSPFQIRRAPSGAGAASRRCLPSLDTPTTPGQHEQGRSTP